MMNKKLNYGIGIVLACMINFSQAAEVDVPATSSSSSTLPVYDKSNTSSPSTTKIQIPVKLTYALCKHKTTADFQTFVSTAANNCSVVADKKSACFTQMQYNPSTSQITVNNCPADYEKVMEFGTAVANVTTGAQMVKYDQDIQQPTTTAMTTFYQNNGYVCGITSPSSATYQVTQLVRGDWPATYGGKNSWTNNGNTDCYLAYCYPRRPDQVLLFPLGTVYPMAAPTLKLGTTVGTQFTYQGKTVEITNIAKVETCINRNTGASLAPPYGNGSCTYSSWPQGGAVPPDSAWKVDYTYTAKEVLCTLSAGYHTPIGANPNGYPIAEVSQDALAYGATIKICSPRYSTYQIRDAEGQNPETITPECATNSQ